MKRLSEVGLLDVGNEESGAPAVVSRRSLNTSDIRVDNVI